MYLNAELDQPLIFDYGTSKLVHFDDKFIIPYRRKIGNKKNLPPIDEKLRRDFVYGQIFLLWHVGLIVVLSSSNMLAIGSGGGIVRKNFRSYG